MRKTMLPAAIAVFLLLFAGCDFLGGGLTVMTGVSLDKSSATVLIGRTERLTATVRPSTASAAGLVWSSDHPAIASVDSEGLVTAKAVGAASISVSNASGTITAACAVSVPPIYIVDTNISASATWTAGNTYYVTAGINILSGAALTIQPGTVVKFDADGSLTADAGSSISAAGTGTAADQAIVFTSFKDLSAGTAIPGVSGTATKGDWLKIEVDGTGNAFAYCRFSYGGPNALAVGMESGIAQVDHCVFRDNGGTVNDPFAAALDVSYAASGTTITNNAFYGNDWPLIIGRNTDLDDSNVFHDPDDPARMNATQAIYIGGYYNAQCVFTASRTLTAAEVAFVTGQQLEVNGPAALAFGADTALKFMADVIMIVHPGASLAYESTSIFTSIRDDAVKGDTDGPSTPAAADGDWKGIYQENSDNAGDGQFYVGTNIRFSADSF